MAEKLLMLALSPTMESGTITEWKKKVGDPISSGDIVCVVETDKAAMDYESTAEGTLLKILKEAGESAEVGAPIGIVGKEGEDISSLAEEKRQPADTKRRVTASPLARVMAREAGLDPARISGTGPGGRVVKRDVEKASGSGAAGPGDRIIPVSGKRKIIAQRLSQSMFTAPHYYLKTTVSAGPLLEARKKVNDKAPEKISVNAFLMKFAAEAIKRHEIINGSWEGEQIRIPKSIDIGLAVALDDGLITPVVRNCGDKGVRGIDEELRELIAKARENKLTPPDYQGASFTISNLGSYGIEEFTAVINPPGSAILAVGAVRRVPEESPDGNVKMKDAMTLTLSCDHRVIDGAAGALFLGELKGMMEEPIRVLL